MLSMLQENMGSKSLQTTPEIPLYGTEPCLPRYSLGPWMFGRRNILAILVEEIHVRCLGIIGRVVRRNGSMIAHSH